MTSWDHNDFDPSYLNSLREVKGLAVLGLLALGWTIGFSAAYGYRDSAEPASVTFGMPTWIFGGVVVPWIVIGALTILFACFFMKDDDQDLLERESTEDESL